MYTITWREDGFAVKMVQALVLPPSVGREGCPIEMRPFFILLQRNRLSNNLDSRPRFCFWHSM